MDQGVIRNLKTIYRKNLLLKLVQEAYDDLRSFWKNLSVLDEIYYVDATWQLVKNSTVKKSWRVILSGKENEIPTDDDGSAHLQRKILEDLRKLNCSENVDEEAVEQWINEDSTLKCCEVLSDNDIVFRFYMQEDNMEDEKPFTPRRRDWYQKNVFPIIDSSDNSSPTKTIIRQIDLCCVDGRKCCEKPCEEPKAHRFTVNKKNLNERGRKLF
ncbi:Tigger transposable element-derived protein 2 [Araneus ventricosus]|uniref:Tigger transposable element-derived protein 2 n=1 Tax=Araneus ventricosus TaxID=182803 RepID=A0A4Y2AQU2_ARAVE|nr:Tigger transposable element-derived protein 2 [Araneus ventricosus]